MANQQMDSNEKTRSRAFYEHRMDKVILLFGLILGLLILLVYVFSRDIPKIVALFQSDKTRLQEVLVPFSSFVGGPDHLYRGKAVELTIFQANEEGTIVAGKSGYAQVRGMLGETPGIAVLAVQTEIAPALQAALVEADTKIVYHNLPQLPTLTPIPSQSDEPTPTSTLMAGYVSWEIPQTIYQPGSKSLKAGDFVRLVIVQQMRAVEEDQAPVVPDPFDSCARIALDYDCRGSLRLQLPADKVAAALQALQNQVHLDIFLDPSCEPE